VEDTRHRLLSIDGGGARGAVALEVLARVESVLRERAGDEDLVLGDWFDYVGGTSTGAIVATGIAMGHPVARISELFDGSAGRIFKRSRLRDQLRHRYDERGLEEVLRAELGVRPLGSPDLRCLLMLGLRNTSTGSPWPVSNNPEARYNQGEGSNLDLPLWKLVRASTAAPTFFPAEEIAVSGGREFLFSDGAVTTLNNPALQLVLMATMPAYNLQWPTGRDELLLVSVGTGTTEQVDPAIQIGDLHLLHHARSVPESLIHSAGVQQDYLCRVLGECRYGPSLDAELGDLVGGAGLLPEPLFSYVRYEAETTLESLNALGVPHLEADHLDQIDGIEYLAEMREFGRALAARVDAAHFAGF
jgi:uncharacterized protein